MAEADHMSMMATKEEDAYDERRPQGIKKEGGEVDDEGEEEENFEIDLNTENCYTLRKTAAFTLATFTSKLMKVLILFVEIFNDEMFMILQPYLERGMGSSNPELIEPAVLVLGIICDEDGAISAVIPHLESIVPFLLTLTSNPYTILRSTVLWTLSRFTRLIVENKHISTQYITILCQRMLDTEAQV